MILSTRNDRYTPTRQMSELRTASYTAADCQLRHLSAPSLLWVSAAAVSTDICPTHCRQGRWHAGGGSHPATCAEITTEHGAGRIPCSLTAGPWRRVTTSLGPLRLLAPNALHGVE